MFDFRRLAVVVCFLATTAAAGEIAVTFDDLPAVGAQTLGAQKAITTRLLRSIRAHGVPVVAFVNENKLRHGEESVRLLRRWLDAGVELGNHTYSHPDLHRIDVAQFEADILRGETITRPLVTARGAKLRWFRHPFLHTGTSLETKLRVERFLAKHGYRVAPVSIDNSEWIFARAYDVAVERKDAEASRRVIDAYVPYMNEKIAYWEEQSRRLFGRDIRHVLLLHANALNAATFDALAAMMKRRGHRFITLERALEDEAYRSPDTYTGRAGLSWIHRWAITAGKPREMYAGEPRVAKWVLELAGIAEE